MNNLYLRLASLEYLKNSLNRNMEIIIKKGYLELQTKRVREKIQDLHNRIQYEIIEIETVNQASPNFNFNYHDVRQYIKTDKLLLDYKKELDEIFLEILNKSNEIVAEVLARLEDMFNHEWILPTSILELLSTDAIEKYKIITSSVDDFVKLQDFIENNQDSIDLDKFFVKELIANYKIEEILRCWHKVSHIEHRYPILEEALQAHKESKYYLSISTLIPQVEGILRDAIRSSGRNANFDRLNPDEMERSVKSLEEQWNAKKNDNCQNIFFHISIFLNNFD